MIVNLYPAFDDFSRISGKAFPRNPQFGKFTNAKTTAKNAHNVDLPVSGRTDLKQPRSATYLSFCNR